ncbi:MAG: tetratricopeptide repeat protein, partial [Anaerolineae bacterium]|nr:tetratricopeptide repeat protein [Anaerolineae bacterium]
FIAHWLRAVTYHLQGEVSVAADMYAQLAPEAPPEMRAAVARAAARALASKGEVREAAMRVGAEGVWYEANMARPIFARQRASQALYAHLALMLGQTEEAESAARAAHEVQGERPDPHADAILCRVLGRVAWERGELAGAAHAFDAELTALNSLPSRDEHEIGIALHNLADVQRALGERERAIANYRRALTHKNPGLEGALTALALAELLSESGRPVEALEAGARAIELLTAPPNADLKAVGHALALQARRQYESGRAPRGEAALKEWITRLAARAKDGLLHGSTGVQALSIGLYLRSEPALDDPIPVIDLAERALHLMESEYPGRLPALAARRDLGVLYARLGRSEEACEVLEPLISDYAATESNAAAMALLTAHHTLARAWTRLGDIPRALGHFDAAAGLEPDPQARGLICREAAEVCREAGDDARSAAYYDRALEQLRRERDIPLYTDTVVALGYTRLRLRRFGEAIDTFEEALHVVEGGAHTDQALKAAVLLDMASAHDTLGQYRRAAETYRRSLSAQDALNEPARYLDTLIALARSEANAGDWQAAVEAYRDALDFDILDETRRRALLAEQGGAYARLGQLQAAINAYDEALTIEGATARERAELHQGLGAIYAKLGAHDQARKHFEAVLTAVQDDRTGQTLKSLADSHRALGQLKESIEVYHRALGFLERNGAPAERAATERALGEIYLERNQFANSLAHLEAALDLERSLPQHQGGNIVSILQNLARAHEMRGELERATVRHHEALVYQDVRHAPDQYVETLCTLGRLYTAMGRPGEAVRAYEEAGRVESSQPEPEAARQDAIVAGLADARRSQGALEVAADLYRQVANSPHRTPARSQAADALTELNAEINRHLKTLEAAEQSLIMLRRASPPDLAGLIFVRALQARTTHALGRWDASAEHLADIFQMLKARGREIRGADPVAKALAALRDAGTAEIAGDPDLAQASYQEALDAANADARANASLIWVIRHRMAPTNTRSG